MFVTAYYLMMYYNLHTLGRTTNIDVLRALSLKSSLELALFCRSFTKKQALLQTAEVRLHIQSLEYYTSRSMAD